MSEKWKSIALLCLSQVLAMTLWFSASAVVPSLVREFSLSALQVSLFTSSVQVGFVVGTLISATLGLADRWHPRRFFVWSSFVAAAANALLLVVDPTSLAAPFLRFLTGVCMAGIYPVGMRMAASWAAGDMGVMVGLLVGSLTLGSASPHLLNAFGGLNWRFTIAAASLLAVCGGVLINFFELGANWTTAQKFRPSLILSAWRVRSLRLANLGYLGHMWELYAMWTWIGVFLQDSFALTVSGGSAGFYAKLATFLTVGTGAIGCLLAGVVADRVGRPAVTMIALAISGSCCLLAGPLFGGNAVVLTVFCMVWGVAVVADSAQFSATVAELCDPAIVGTMLTVQVCLGFLLTLVTIHLTPYLRDLFTWRYAFMFLAIGPALGIGAMNSLRIRSNP